MIDNEKSNFEKIIMAGIGAITKTAENAGDLLEELVTKGELSVEQGKALNEELKHEIKESINEAAQKVQSSAVSSFVKNMDKLTSDEIALIRAKIDELENAKGD